MAQTFLDASVGSLSSSGGTAKYGSLSQKDAFTIQKKFLAIAKRNLVFSRFAQKETKAQNDGLEVRWRRYEKFNLPMVPLAEGVKPPADDLTQVTLKVRLHQYGSYVSTTDVLVAAHTDPVIQQIVERQGIQAAELMDFLSFIHFRSGTQAAYAGSVQGTPVTSAVYRYQVNRTVGMTKGRRTAAQTSSTELLDIAIRALENNEAMKIAKIVKPSAAYDTSAIPDSYMAVCHPDLRQDIQDLPGFIPYQKYANGGMQSIAGELGAVGLVRFILTTQAAPYGQDPTDPHTTDRTRVSYDTTRLQEAAYTEGFASSPTYASGGIADSSDYGEYGTPLEGSSTTNGEVGQDITDNDGSGEVNEGVTLLKSGGTNKARVYPILIFSTDAIGCVSLSGFDSVVPKVVMPQPAVTDPLGQTGSVGWKTWYACKILQEEWMYRLDVACSSLS
tara:strand:+ start:1108 stop:2442 length:1335 start_codon:yes stop_codon:yes gene_type:complete